MSAPSELVIDIVDLPHAVGATKDVRLRVPAPPGLGTAVIGTPEGSPVAVDATLTVLADGVLVRATADLHVHGECVRCLQDLDEDRTVRLEELYHLPREAAQDEEDQDVLLLGETTLDLEPALRDALVGDLPFRPLCRPDCRGLCPRCGERLDDLPPGHHHQDRDPRWSALASLLAQTPQDDADGQGRA